MIGYLVVMANMDLISSCRGPQYIVSFIDSVFRAGASYTVCHLPLIVQNVLTPRPVIDRLNP